MVIKSDIYPIVFCCRVFCFKTKKRKEVVLVLGMGDFSIFLVYVLCIASAVACVVYGIINWNKGEEPKEELQKDKEWETKDTEIKEDLDI